MTTHETLIFGGFVIIALLTIYSAYVHVAKERNDNSDSNNSSDSPNGEDV